MPPDVPIESKVVTRAIRSAQTQVEQQNFEIRKNVLKYDEVLNKQRKVIYDERRRVLEGEDLHEQVRHMIDEVVTATSPGRPARATRGVGPRPAVDGAADALPGFTAADEVEEAGGERAEPGALAEVLRPTPSTATTSARGTHPGGHARARAARGALGARPQVARAPLRDGLPAGGHRPARMAQRTRWWSTSARASTCSPR